jgi:predicted metalloprotease with PDZ domain
MRTTLFLLFLCTFSATFAQSDKVQYTLNHTVGSPKIEIIIEPSSVVRADAHLVIPRSGPGTYDLTNYMAFIENVNGYTSSGQMIKGSIGIGSFFYFEDNQEALKKVSYEVDIEKMEATLLGGFASSKLRDNYLGILGYSMFGFIEGLEHKPISLNINTAEDWPIFSTLAPSSNRPTGTATFDIDNYALLADAQFLLGKGVQLHQVKEAPIPLFVAVYAETPVNLEEIGRRGQVALDGLADYFGYIPMPHYTLCYEFLIPYSYQHDYGFSMEHMNSMTASMDTSRAVTAYNPEARISSIVHHIGHSWIPLRSYGSGYRPFEWQTAPLIETIWLNEGFIWYVTNYNVLDNPEIINFFKRIVETAPDYIQSKSLKELSLLGSTQYSLDFNIGRNLYARGALMAHDLDLHILQETKGEKSFKYALLALLKWTEENQSAFKYDEISQIITKGTGVDISDIWDSWQGPQIMK